MPLRDDRQQRLADIAARQRARRDARQDERDQPETDARVELARTDDGTVRAPTQAELMIVGWESALLAPVFAATAHGVLQGTLLAGYRALSIGAGVAAVSGVARLVYLTRLRHVEHVRVSVFLRGDPLPPLLVLVTLGYVGAFLVMVAMVL